MSRARAFVVATGEPVAPFREEAGALEVLGRPLAELQREILESLGLDVTFVDGDEAVGDGPCLVLRGWVHATRTCLARFLDQARVGDRPRRLALSDSAFVRFTQPLMELEAVAGTADGQAVSGASAWAYDVFWVPSGRFAALSAADFDPVVIQVAERELPTSPTAPTRDWAEPIPIGVTTTAAFHVRHWVHLLLANVVGGLCFTAELVRRPRTWAWLAWRLLLAFPWTKRRLVGGFYRKGRRGFVHPMASVEGSILGDDVVVDAGAVVRGSIVADGAHIGPHARVLFTVVGRKARVGWNGITSFTVLMAGAELAFPGIQMSVLGRGAWLASGASLYDVSFAGPVRLRTRHGEAVATHHHLIGVAVGHRALIGAGVGVAAGREIPNDTRWVADGGGLVYRIPPDLEPGTYRVVDGAAVAADARPTRART